MVKIKELKDFNLDHIFNCGQCFRWVREGDGSYTGIAFGKIVNMKTTPGRTMVDLEIDHADQDDFEKIWKHYLDLERDYGEIKKQLSKTDSVMAKAIEFGYGIRILNQDKWETIISFLISQNNNIPRIKKCIDALCENFGEYIGEYRGKKYYDLPKPQRLSRLSIDDLAKCRLGYRAKYIIETAMQIEKEGIGETFEYLTTLCGVGPKVANCILLFSMEKADCFPIDVWVKRVMNQLYGIAEEDTNAMLEYSKKNFKEYGGIAQQYLFYYIREGQNKVDEEVRL
ncbi:MAG: 8-oxoguanine DNA glycosylase [Peptostreptococcaceae bacterium]|nr:8-oxoguanine DNA glycosylase [Peptostreptococcaceae bacterium]